MTFRNAKSPDPAVLSDRMRQERLDSWKEIATYLSRDVRTVRRWETGQALPVHRHHHRKGASIYAYKSELDAWWQNGKQRLAAQGTSTLNIPVLWPAARPSLEIALPDQLPRRNMFRAGLAAAVVILLSAAVYLGGKRVQSSIRGRPIVVAVLPFEDLDLDPQDYLVYGFTEEMIATLTRVNPQHLHVIARTSAMQYRHTSKSARQIGQDLAADYILENSFRRQGERFRITTQLVRTSDQTHVWAENYDRERSGLLSIQGEVTTDIARQIARQLLPSLAPVNVLDQPQRRVDSIAHDLYLQGRYYASLRSRDGLEKSIEALSQAIGKDPQYAAAYAALADTYNLIAFYGFDPSMNAVSRAKIAADHALSLDGSLAAAHATLGYTEFMWRQDWSAADREFRRAIELDDNYVPAHQWYALYLAALGRMDQSLQQIEKALRLDPLSPPVHATMGYMYYLDRDYPHAIEQAKEALQLDPNLMVAHAVLGWAYTEQGSYSAAIEELQTSVRLSRGAPIYVCTLGRAYALSGNRDEARRIASQVGVMENKSLGSGAALSALFLALGNPEDALRWLEETAPGDIQANWLRVEPAFDPLRGNPRFEAVVRRIEIGQR